MNAITQLFKDISDDELAQAVSEIREDSASGIICDGVVRKYTKLIKEITGLDNNMDLFFSEINLLREAAYRWVNLKNLDEYYRD